VMWLRVLVRVFTGNMNRHWKMGCWIVFGCWCSRELFAIRTALYRHVEKDTL
jgi:hypothetical protein